MRRTGYYQRLKRKFKAICPYTESGLQSLCDKVFFQVLGLAALLLLLLWFWCGRFQETSLVFLFLSSFLTVFLAAIEIPEAVLRHKEDGLFQEMVSFFSKVSYSYSVENNMPGAIQKAVEELGEELRLHATEFYLILLGGNRREKVREYVLFSQYNRYLKLFLIQAYEASEKGDVKVSEEGTLFSDNLEYLRVEVMEERYRRKKEQHEFAGYTFVTLVPFFVLPLLKRWGLSFAPELSGFYEGFGKVLEAVAFLVTVSVYLFINQAKGVKLSSQREEGTYFFGRLLKPEKMKAVILFFTAFIAALCFLLSTENGTSGWKNIGIGILCCLCFSGGMAGLPYLLLLYKKKLLQEEAEQELKQFQSVLIMERRLADATIQELLEDMEIFAHLFKNVLRECINSYQSGPMTALKRLKQEGRKLHPGFEELAEGFLAVDEVGIKKAFATVENNRLMLKKMSQLETEIQLEQKKGTTELLSKLPAFFSVGAYFIVPFFVSSLQGVTEVFQILEEMQF